MLFWRTLTFATGCGFFFFISGKRPFKGVLDLSGVAPPSYDTSVVVVGTVIAAVPTRDCY